MVHTGPASWAQEQAKFENNDIGPRPPDLNFKQGLGLELGDTDGGGRRCAQEVNKPGIFFGLANTSHLSAVSLFLCMILFLIRFHVFTF